MPGRWRGSVYGTADAFTSILGRYRTLNLTEDEIGELLALRLEEAEAITLIQITGAALVLAGVLIISAKPRLAG